MTKQSPSGGRRGSRRLAFATGAALVIGISPIVANIASEAVASSLGCYIAEFSIYSRSGTYNDFYDDVPGCTVGSVDVGAALVGVHTFGLAISVTWPFVLLAMILGAKLLTNRHKSRRSL